MLQDENQGVNSHVADLELFSSGLILAIDMESVRCALHVMNWKMKFLQVKGWPIFVQ